MSNQNSDKENLEAMAQAFLAKSASGEIRGAVLFVFPTAGGVEPSYVMTGDVRLTELLAQMEFAKLCPFKAAVDTAAAKRHTLIHIPNLSGNGLLNRN